MNEIQSFISTLTQVSGCQCKNPQYIHKNDDSSFQIISSKSDKNLNTQEIGNLATGYIRQLNKNTDLTLAAKAEYCNKLSQVLKQYNQRIRRSKSGIYRLLACLGFKSSQEKTIDGISQDILCRAKLFARRSQRFDQIVAEKVAKENNPTDETILTLFNLKVLDSINFEIYKEDSFSLTNKASSLAPFQSLESIIRDLDAFKLSLNDEESQKLVQEAIQELQFNLRVTALVPQALFTFAGDVMNSRILAKDFLSIEEIVEEILIKMKQLTSTSPSLIFGGGYARALKTDTSTNGSAGHYVLHKIQKQPNDLYTFAIINTGDGAKIVKNEIEDEKQALVKAKEKLGEQLNQAQNDIDKLKIYIPLLQINQKILNLELTPIKKVEEVVYADLTEQELTKAFFMNLLSFASSGAENMEVINQFINASLFHPLNPNLVEGRSYNKQQKGSCTVKPPFKWLHGKFGPKLYQQFSIFRIDRDLASLDKLNPGNELVGKRTSINPKTKEREITEYRGQELIQFMKAQGMVIRERKEKKLASLI